MSPDKDNLVKQWWRQLAFDLPRVPSHAESRRRVGFVLISIVIVGLIVAVFWGPIAYFEYRFGGGWGGVLAVIVMYALALAVRRSIKRRGNTLSLNLNTAPLPSLRDGILRQRTILATLVNRAAFEAHLAQSAGTARPSGNVRAGQLHLLRQRRLWDELPLPLRDMLSEAEGSWTPARFGHILLHLESVRVLSWAVRENCQLPPLRIASTVSPGILQTALAEVDDVSDVAFLRSEAEMEAQTAPTLAYLARLQNELVERKVVDGEFDATMAGRTRAYMAYAASMGEAEILAEDLPVGRQLIGEVGSDDLLNLRGIAAIRYLALEALRASQKAKFVAPFVTQIMDPLARNREVATT